MAAQSNEVPVLDTIRPSRPVFILGVAERSGTTYLQDLLRLHPDCDVDALELEEDHFLVYADLLIRYVDEVFKHWKPRFGPEQYAKERELLCSTLGKALVSYQKAQIPARRALTNRVPVETEPRVLVTKTPDVTNLELFFRFFPDADLLILMRDGRAVVESAIRTFYRNFADETRRWARRSSEIKQFDGANRGARYLILRYEDLYTDTETEVRRILEFLRLDASSYSFDAARNLPVRGSCTLRSRGPRKEDSVAPGIHWDPVPKTTDFQPLERWRHWSRAKHERFNWIAGRSLAEFSYVREHTGGIRWPWVLWNLALDIVPVEKAFHYASKVRLEMAAAANPVDGVKRVLKKARSRIRPARLPQPRPAGAPGSSEILR